MGSAVVVGELSEGQANVVLDRFRRSASSRGMVARKQRCEQFMNEIKEAFEAGKLSEEEAEEKLIHVRR